MGDIDAVPEPAPELCLVAVGQVFDHPVRAALAGGFPHPFLVADIVQRAVADVCVGGLLVASVILEDHPDLPAQTRGIELANVNAVDSYSSGIRLIEPAQELDNRSLARAVRSDERRRFSGRYPKAHPLEHRLVGARVSEMDVLEHNAFFYRVGYLDAPGFSGNERLEFEELERSCLRTVRARIWT